MPFIFQITTMKIILIGWGSGSWKTTLATWIRDFVGKDKVQLVFIDDYYQTDHFKDPSMPREEFNFDDPAVIGWDILKQNLQELLAGKPTKKPIYDFVKSHTVGWETIEPKPLIVVEGIFALYPDWLRQMADLKIFVDADLDVMLSRRLKRDVTQRWRDLDEVLNRWFRFVKPWFLKYVAPYKDQADVVIQTNSWPHVVVPKFFELLKI